MRNQSAVEKSDRTEGLSHGGLERKLGSYKPGEERGRKEEVKKIVGKGSLNEGQATFIKPQSNMILCFL